MVQDQLHNSLPRFYVGSPRILIVTYNWPPRNAIGTHRPYSWAKYWSQWGANITVLTACKYGFDEPLDLHLPKLESVRVCEVPYFRSGAASVSSGRARNGVVARLKAVRRVLSKTLGVDLDIRRGWFRAAAAQSALLAPNCDAVVSSYGPAASHLLAAGIKKINPALRWTADYRDLWNTRAKSSRRSMQEERSTVGTFADALTTVSDELAEELRKRFQQKIDVIYNGYDDASLAAVTNRNSAGRSSGSGTRCVRIVYTGLITPGDRDPTPLFRAIKELEHQLKKTGVTIRVEFYGARLGNLKRIIEREDAEDFSIICGHVDRDTALRQQALADALLILESPSKEGNLTGKLFEYLAVGRPIISVGSRKQSAIGRLLGDCGSGICVEEDVNLLKGALLDVATGSRLGWFLPKAERILQYSRENQARRMFDIICP